MLTAALLLLAAQAPDTVAVCGRDWCMIVQILDRVPLDSLPRSVGSAYLLPSFWGTKRDSGRVWE